MTEKNEMIALADRFENATDVIVRDCIFGKAPVLTGNEVRLIASALRTAAASAEPVAWQPIETAPADGKVLIVGGSWLEPNIVISDGGWWRMRKREGSKGIPTHWMPIPELPK